MRIASILLAALVAATALPVGAMLVVAPDGHLLQAPTSLLLAGLPFTTFLIPGLLLVVVVGAGALAVLVAQLLRARAAPAITTAYGVVLMGWIVVQVAVTHGGHPLQAITFAAGAALVLLGGERDWLAWVATNAVAELVGLGAVALGVWTAAQRGLAGAGLSVAMIALGAVEGLVVGAAQAQILRGWLPALRRFAWIRATVGGAIVAWALGSLPSLLMGEGGGARGPSETAQTLLAAALGLVAGPILAAFQARVLRRHVRGAGWWLVANAVAWAAAMPFVFAAVSVVAAGGGIGRAVALLLAAGGVAGAVHGPALLALVRRGSCSTSEGDVHGVEQHAGRRAALAGR